MSVAILLGILATFDLVLAGFRAAAGRDGRIHKGPMLRGAMLRAAGWGALVIAAHLVLVAILVQTGDAQTWPAFVAAGRDAVLVFGCFATLVAVALLFWFSPVHELRIVPTLVVLGPLTLLRPIVIIGGLGVAAARSSEPRVWLVAAIACVSMLAMERLLGRRYRERWRLLRAAQ